MLFKILFVYLCFNIAFIQSKMNSTYKLHLVSNSRNCTIPPQITLMDGQDLIVRVSPYLANYGWCRLMYADSSLIDYSEPFKKFTIPKVNKTIEGLWEFKLLFHKDNMDTNGHIVNYGKANYTQNICRTNVTIVPSSADSSTTMNTEMYIIIVAVIVSLIIIAQTVYIIYLRGRARAITRHRNLSKHSDQTNEGKDKARYCSNPRQKVMKVPPIVDTDRESVIYHVPQIEMSNFPERDPAELPQPPAVNTIPRSPRTDNIARMGQQTLLAAAMQGSVNPPVANGTFPRNQHQINVANRPRLPLPVPNDTYEEMEIGENTYEPPPMKNMLPQMPQVLPFVSPPIKNVQPHMIPFEPTPNKNVLPKSEQLPPGRLSVLQKGLRPTLNSVAKAPMKPAVTPKPHTSRPEHNMAPIKELEHIWKNRNVVPVPVQTIPEPNTSKGTQKPNPAPAPKAKPPMPIPVQEEIYYNERQDSSDEEWTYEPLKPFNTDNIYNI